MNKFPKISVIMSVYNEPLQWISQAIDSILNQTYANYEFIIINDNPNRVENKSFLNSFRQQDDRIIIITNEFNIGLAKSLNKGIEIAKGKYIARMDADDISLPSRFEKQLDFLNTNPEYGICGTFACTIDSYGRKGKILNIQANDENLKNALYFFCPFLHPTVMIRRELLEIEKYDIECRIGQDWDLWKRLASFTKFVNIPKVLLLYRIHDNQSVKKAGFLKTLNSTTHISLKDIERLKLASNISDIYIRFRRGEELNKNELDILFMALLENKNLYKSYKYIISIYVRNKKKDGILGLFINPLFAKNPLRYCRAIILEYIRYRKMQSMFLIKAK